MIIAPTPFFADRGCHVRILGEARALQNLGHQLKICTYHLGEDINGIETVRTLCIPWYRKLSAGPSVHKLYIDLLLIWKVLFTCLAFRPHLIHAHLHEGIVIGKVASLVFRVPMVADLQGSLTEELLDHKFIPRWTWLVQLLLWMEKKINQMPNHLIASSAQTRRSVIERFRLSENSVTSISDGVDLELFGPRAKDFVLRDSLGIAPEDKVVVFIGVLTTYQGIDLLLEAIPKVRRDIAAVKFLIIGFPEDGYRQRARMLRVADSTIFTGKIPYTNSPKYLALGDVAVSPKVSTTEANLKLFTYMAMGLPTVVFENPVNLEILGNRGIYAKQASADSLAEALVLILKDEDRRKELGEACYQKAVVDYSWRSVGLRLSKVYQERGGLG